MLPAIASATSSRPPAEALPPVAHTAGRLNPRSSSVVPLASAADALVSESLLLSLERQTQRLEHRLARGILRAAAARLAVQRQERLHQIRRAIEAAHSRSWWESLVAALKVVSVAATAVTGGTLGAVAAALIVASAATEPYYPRAALALQIAAAALLVQALAVQGALAAAGAAPPSLPASALTRLATYVAPGAQAVATGPSVVAGHYAAVELRAMAARLRCDLAVEAARHEQRRELATLRRLVVQDAALTRRLTAAMEERHRLALQRLAPTPNTNTCPRRTS